MSEKPPKTINELAKTLEDFTSRLHVKEDVMKSDLRHVITTELDPVK